jgi:hypothetical protein
MVLAAIPGFGSFAYLGAKPVRANRLLLRALADAAGRKAPWRLYERIGLRRLVARPVDGAVAPLPVPVGPLAPAAWWGEEAAAAA